MKFKIRKGTHEDASFVFSQIKNLAKFEKAEEQVTLTLERLIEDGFSKEGPALYETLIFEEGTTPCGFALYYNRYSTWKGKSLYLEDLFILPEFRRRGLARMAFKELARIAVETSCYRFEWQVLDWNTPAIKLYEELGADLDGEWMNCRLEGERILKLARN